MKGKAVNILHHIGNAYEQIASGDAYKRNDNQLRIIQVAVVIVSAIATGFTNAFAHRERIGDAAAFGLALLIVLFVERFYFVLRDGLTSIYTAGRQRFYAQVCYRVIQLSMILNATILTAWIVGFDVPRWLELWNHWSIVCHFSLALLGVQAVRDSDSVIENRMVELKSATAKQDIVTLRKSAAFGSPLALLAARLRGLFDSVALSFRLLFSGGGFAKQFVEQINQAAREQYAVQPANALEVVEYHSPIRRENFTKKKETQRTIGSFDSEGLARLRDALKDISFRLHNRSFKSAVRGDAVFIYLVRANHGTQEVTHSAKAKLDILTDAMRMERNAFRERLERFLKEHGFEI